MTPTVVVAIRQDPRKSAQPVEAMRIALGLAAGDNPLTVILAGEAPHLLAEEEDTVLDGDILEKYLPSVKEMNIPFIIPQGSLKAMDVDPDFNVREASLDDVRQLIATADRTLVF